MAKPVILKENKDFKTAYYRGKSFVHPLLIVYVRKTRNPMIRIGITTGKKIGNAVQRSRCRRVIREAYRSVREELPSGGFDIVFVARRATAEVKSPAVTEAMRALFKKAGLLL